MNNKTLKIKKFLVLPFIVATFFIPLSEAKAQGISVPSWDALSIIETITQQASDIAGEMAQQLARIEVDTAVYTAGQMLLDQVTDDIVTWVKGGFNGSPSFAVDPTKLFLDLADAVSGGMASQIRGIATCDFTPNFNNDLANMVDLSTRNDAGNKYAYQIRCPFPAVNINASDFYNDFNRGGWSAFEMALSDNGNAFGVAVLTSDELAKRQQEARATQEMRSNWSNGFADLVDTNDCPTMPSEVSSAIENDELPIEAKKAYQKSYCKTTTPGKIVGDRLGQAVGVDMDRLGFVDNINKIMGAVVKEATNQAVSGIFQN
ncbi:MAG: hypothetical protein COV32_02930 [Candidatus Yonathbacteria bacterium CG10_big_fil_rev_8_21_14_0_10_43_136]|uniref:Uncharacterized protein n=2 Tax=Parcubacteria group TaxID=1794811 RepID=A0A2M7Q521_9BACT|nr:MAG: hypothetical protein AUK15_00040 [Candidatus Nomurabacteria bacterium CG2_30_43_9]PIQ35507.1 MAG: hypothetical protein COW60_03655 [Candidatus Yonathbacteria bacterium CG17_big_fil_post_rev_8_21_14_2_50_43_9]PIR40516.1 MAG: hypothetical protein COV32_02930 [Candidatus Yonathbacteria bacterium CG10_big_fil_rev_8_21_14_0_10_43_136]PIX57430.1 MAG: hypothetical protein COZ48_00740 [Candidatus Yonathbacteria bacterium CG_4_10_14_3_um_filter_43_12]PIY58537.1 MAG: hypothetical protein COY98_01